MANGNPVEMTWLGHSDAISPLSIPRDARYVMGRQSRSELRIRLHFAKNLAINLIDNRAL